MIAKDLEAKKLPATIRVKRPMQTFYESSDRFNSRNYTSHLPAKVHSVSTRNALPLPERKKQNMNATISEALGQQHRKKSDLLQSHLQNIKRRKLEEPTKLEDLKRLRSRQKASALDPLVQEKTIPYESVRATSTDPYGLEETKDKSVLSGVEA